jgi:hypothetical protein
MKPRPSQIPYLDRALTAAQRHQLRRWLAVDGITYAAAVVRLKELFGVDSSIRQLCAFWQRTCEPKPKEKTKCGRPVLLDLRVSKKADGWQFLLLNRARGLRVSINGRKLRPCVTMAAKT